MTNETTGVRQMDLQWVVEVDETRRESTKDSVDRSILSSLIRFCASPCKRKVEKEVSNGSQVVIDPPVEG